MLVAALFLTAFVAATVDTVLSRSLTSAAIALVALGLTVQTGLVG